MPAPTKKEDIRENNPTPPLVTAVIIIC
jgi:hypothetical protein